MLHWTARAAHDWLWTCATQSVLLCLHRVLTSATYFVPLIAHCARHDSWYVTLAWQALSKHRCTVTSCSTGPWPALAVHSGCMGVDVAHTVQCMPPAGLSPTWQAHKSSQRPRPYCLGPSARAARWCACSRPATAPQRHNRHRPQSRCQHLLLAAAGPCRQAEMPVEHGGDTSNTLAGEQCRGCQLQLPQSRQHTQLRPWACTRKMLTMQSEDVAGMPCSSLRRCAARVLTCELADCRQSALCQDISADHAAQSGCAAICEGASTASGLDVQLCCALMECCTATVHCSPS